MFITIILVIVIFIIIQCDKRSERNERVIICKYSKSTIQYTKSIPKIVGNINNCMFTIDERESCIIKHKNGVKRFIPIRSIQGGFIMSLHSCSLGNTFTIKLL